MALARPCLAIVAIVAVQLLIIRLFASDSNTSDRDPGRELRRRDTALISSAQTGALLADGWSKPQPSLPRRLSPTDVDPLPGVHMVYMYANGSDPGIASVKPQYGGPSVGTCA